MNCNGGQFNRLLYLIYFKDIFSSIILRPLLTQPFRSLITIFGVAIGVGVFLSIQLANRQTLHSFRESVDLVLGKTDAIIHADGLSSLQRCLGGKLGDGVGVCLSDSHGGERERGGRRGGDDGSRDYARVEHLSS